jgi:hypothetical protein
MPPGIASYLGVSFAIAWICWGLCWLIINFHLGLPLDPVLILGSFGPFIAAGYCAWGEGGWPGIRRFYARAVDLRMGWLVFLVAVFLPPALATIAARVFAWQFHQAFAFQMSWADIPVAYVWLFFLGGPVGEEFGWSYLSDRLDEKFPLFGATLLLGVIWGFWHLPLFYLIVPGLLQHYLPFYAFLFFSICVRFLFAWAYHKANRNILSNLLIHNALNFALSIVVIVAPVAERYHLRLWYFAVLNATAAFVLQRLAPVRSQVVMKPPPRIREPA